MKLVLAVALALVAFTAPAHAAPFQWSAPQPFDTAPPHPDVPITALDCPTATFCVGVDADGAVITSTDPTGGPAAWQRTADVIPDGFANVDCASPTLCVAVGWSQMATSTNPTGGAGAWKTFTPANGYLLNGVSCPAVDLCVAVDGWGSIFTSTNPNGGADAWQYAEKVNTSQYLDDVSCPSVNLCVAVGGSFVTSTTNPTGGKAAWSNTLLSGSFLYDVECASTTACVLVDTGDGSPGGGRVGTSSNPTGGAAAWTLAQGSLGRTVSCPTTTLCAATTTAPGTIATTTNPAAPWKPATVSLGIDVSAISCPTAGLCVAGDASGQIHTATTPLDGPWTSARVNVGRNRTRAIDCVTAALCVAVNGSGSVLTSTAPASGGPWTSRTASSDDLLDVACPSSALCVATDADGGIVTSTTPTTGGWTRAATGAGYISAVACASSTLCVAANSSGYIGVSTDPAGGVSAWTAEKVPGVEAIYGLDCPSATLCVGADFRGHVVSSINPTGGAAAWKAVKVAANLLDVSCPSTTLCFAVGMQGEILRSTDPTGPAASWTSTKVAENVYSIDCASETVCVAGSESGTLYELDGATWKAVRMAPGRVISGVSCPSPLLCLAVVFGGDLLVGRGASAPLPTPPAVRLDPVTDTGERSVRLHGAVASVTALTACRFEVVGGPTVPCEPGGTSATVTGLEPGTTYRYRLVAENAGGTGQSEEGTFATSVRIVEDFELPKPVGTPTPTPQPNVTPVTAAEITAAAKADLVPRGAGAKLSTILKRKGYTMRTRALVAGRADIRWYATVKGKRVAVAAGAHTFAAPGAADVVLKLSAKGRALVRGAKKLSLVAEQTFTPTGGKAVKTTRKLTLKR